MRYLFVLYLLLTTLNVRGQYADPMELHDSIFLKFFLKDSIDEYFISSIHGSSQTSYTLKNPCLVTNAEIYANDINLYDLHMPYVLLYEDNFDNVIDNNFWKVVKNCDEECWDDPNAISSDVCDELLKKGPAVTYYDSSENVFIAQHENWNGTSNGILTLKAIRDKRTRHNKIKNIDYDYEFTSGFIHTKKAFPFESGVFQARIKLPARMDDGLWPAFWLMSQGTDPWNEIDIFEFFDTDLRLNTTVHVNPNETGNNEKKQCGDEYWNTAAFFNQWHIYTCYWNRFGIAIFIDNNLIWHYSHFLKHNRRKDYKEINIPKGRQVDRKLFYPTKSMRIMFNLATYYCNKTRTNNAVYPQILEMDWIKIWYKKPCNQDISITDSLQIPQLSDVYNTIVGRNVVINCNYTMPANTFLKIIHSGNLTNYQNLKAGPDGYLEIMPQAAICQFEDPITPQARDIYNNYTNEDNHIEIYPNPNKGRLRIVYNSNTLQSADINIFNINGELVQNSKIILSAENYIDMSKLKEGFYYIEIKSSKNIVIKRDKLIICQK
jgi:beta-glucanase (GH16 family)